MPKKIGPITGMPMTGDVRLQCYKCGLMFKVIRPLVANICPNCVKKRLKAQNNG